MRLLISSKKHEIWMILRPSLVRLSIWNPAHSEGMRKCIMSLPKEMSRWRSNVYARLSQEAARWSRQVEMHLGRRHFLTLKYQRTARELEAWSQLRHENVLELLGLALFKDRLAMVSAWMKLGTVVNFVNDRPSVNRYKLVCAVSLDCHHRLMLSY